VSKMAFRFIMSAESHKASRFSVFSADKLGSLVHADTARWLGSLPARGRELLAWEGLETPTLREPRR